MWMFQTIWVYCRPYKHYSKTAGGIDEPLIFKSLWIKKIFWSWPKAGLCSAEDCGLNRSPILQCSRMAILDTICLLRHQWHDWWLARQETPGRKQNKVGSGQHCRFVIRGLLCHPIVANIVNSIMAMDLGWYKRHHQDCQSDIILDHHQKILLPSYYSQ